MRAVMRNAWLAKKGTVMLARLICLAVTCDLRLATMRRCAESVGRAALRCDDWLVLMARTGHRRRSESLRLLP